MVLDRVVVNLTAALRPSAGWVVLPIRPLRGLARGPQKEGPDHKGCGRGMGQEVENGVYGILTLKSRGMAERYKKSWGSRRLF